MTAPEVDKAQRLVDNLEEFIHKHRAEIFQISAVMNEDIDEVVMDMVLAGYVEVRNQAQQMSEVSNEEWSKVVELTSKIIDMVQNGMEQGKAVTIITNEGRQIADALYERLGRTCTLLEGRGLISGEKVVLYCVVTRIEVATVKQIIHAMDGTAFVTITDVSEILGQHIKQNTPLPSGKDAE